MLSMAQAWAKEPVTRFREKLFDNKSKYVTVVAHRGDWRNSPENSIQAFKSCIEMGVDMIEIDVRITKDNELVIIHDATVDRTTNGKGKVADLTLESACSGDFAVPLHDGAVKFYQDKGVM